MQDSNNLDPQITIVIPVYGRASLLEQALSSVYRQSDPVWALLIADDGSDSETATLIDKQKHDKRVTVIRREKNIGLFGNLNSATKSVLTKWQLILCSDDYLEVNAISDLKQSIVNYPDASLILSSYNSVDEKSQRRVNANSLFYDKFSPTTKLYPPPTLLPQLLHYGSINGNISGMLIRNTLFEEVGYWRATWSQAADWEWLIRATSLTSTLIRREPIANVRVHEGQLSVSNRKCRTDTNEVLSVLAILLKHPVLITNQRRYSWSAYHAQFILWNTLKTLRASNLLTSAAEIIRIHNIVGLRITILAMIRSIPKRFRIRNTQLPLLPED